MSWSSRDDGSPTKLKMMIEQVQASMVIWISLRCFWSPLLIDLRNFQVSSCSCPCILKIMNCKVVGILFRKN